MRALALLLLAAPTWSLVEKTDGVEVYSRDVEGERVAELKLITVSKLPIDALCLAAYGDGALEPGEPDVTSRQLVWEDGGTRVCYEKVQASVVSDRDYAVLSYMQPTAGGGCRTHFEAANKYAPPLPAGFVRIDRMRGGWTFEPVAGGNVVCTYTVFCDPGGSVPAVFVESPRRKSALQWVKHVMTRAATLQRVPVAAAGGRDAGRD